MIPIISFPSMPTVPNPNMTALSFLSSIPQIALKEHTVKLDLPVFSKKEVNYSQKDKEMHQQVLQKLQDNPDMLQSLIEFARFETTKHNIHNNDRPCYKGDVYDQCDDCYSGDTEFEHNEEMSSFFKEFSFLFPKNDEIDDSEEGEDDDENDKEEAIKNWGKSLEKSVQNSNQNVMPTMPTIPMGSPSKEYVPSVLQENCIEEISVVVFKTDYYREVKHGFILTYNLYLVGVSEDGVNMRDATDNEKEIAKKMRITV